jgi:hypothetical protein
MHLAVSQLDPVSSGIFSGFNQPMAAYMGDKYTPRESNPFEKRPRDVWTFSDAKAGQYEEVADTMADLMFSDQRFMTTTILPWRETNTVNMSISRFESQPFLMRNNPALTPAHLMHHPPQGHLLQV